MDCFLAITKFLFFVFTFALWVIGLAGFGTSIYFMVKYDDIYDATDSYTLSYVSIAVLIFSILFVVLGFLGCCGTWKKSKCMLYLFAVILAVLLIGEVSLAIYCLVERTDVEDQVSKGLEKTMDQYLDDESTMKAWDGMQKTVKCCGTESGPEDWYDTIADLTFPKSCCKTDACKANPITCPNVDPDNKDPPTCVQGSDAVAGAYDEGCATKIDDILKDNFALIAAVGFVFGFVQLLGIFSAVHIGSDAGRQAKQWA